jgi:hypothetical protein
MGLPGLIGSQVPDGPDAVWVTLKAIQAQAQQVQAQVGSVQALLTLTTQQLALATQQNTLNSQQIALQNQQIALAANQVVPDVGSASGTAVWGIGYSTFCSFSFTVPSGYTRALIFASGGSATFSNAASDDFRLRVLINGVAGGEGRGVQNDWSYISATAAANIGSLVGGSTISVAVQGHLTTGPGGTAGTATVTGTAIYLK